MVVNPEAAVNSKLFEDSSALSLANFHAVENLAELIVELADRQVPALATVGVTIMGGVL